MPQRGQTALTSARRRRFKIFRIQRFWRGVMEARQMQLMLLLKLWERTRIDSMLDFKRLEKELKVLKDKPKKKVRGRPRAQTRRRRAGQRLPEPSRSHAAPPLWALLFAHRKAPRPLQPPERGLASLLTEAPPGRRRAAASRRGRIRSGWRWRRRSSTCRASRTRLCRTTCRCARPRVDRRRFWAPRRPGYGESLRCAGPRPTIRRRRRRRRRSTSSAGGWRRCAPRTSRRSATTVRRRPAARPRPARAAPPGRGRARLRRCARAAHSRPPSPVAVAVVEMVLYDADMARLESIIEARRAMGAAQRDEMPVRPRAPRLVFLPPRAEMVGRIHEGEKLMQTTKRRRR